MVPGRRADVGSGQGQRYRGVYRVRLSRRGYGGARGAPALAGLGYEGELETVTIPFKEPKDGHLTVDKQACNAIHSALRCLGRGGSAGAGRSFLPVRGSAAEGPGQVEPDLRQGPGSLNSAARMYTYPALQENYHIGLAKLLIDQILAHHTG